MIFGRHDAENQALQYVNRPNRILLTLEREKISALLKASFSSLLPRFSFDFTFQRITRDTPLRIYINTPPFRSLSENHSQSLENNLSK